MCLGHSRLPASLSGRAGPGCFLFSPFSFRYRPIAPGRKHRCWRRRSARLIWSTRGRPGFDLHGLKCMRREHSAVRCLNDGWRGHTMHSAWFGEFMGTLVLVLLGNGVNAGVTLRKSYAADAGWIVITTGWALGVLCGVIVAQGFGSHDAG